jgi:hypothetical protein
MVRPGGRRPIFGPIDPYCVPAVASLAGVAVVLMLAGGLLFGVALGVLALLILAFDSWVNRDAGTDRRHDTPARYSRR